jgi:hypothetical protein
MQEQIVCSSELVATFVHCNDPDCEGCQEQLVCTWPWLNSLMAENANMTEAVPAVISVRDPRSGRLLVYDGNMRTCHADVYKYSLRAQIIRDQQDFDEYLANHEALWSGITDFTKLLAAMNDQVDSLIQMLKQC